MEQPPLAKDYRGDASSTAGNKYPVVLVYGCAGWGRDEMFGIKCWGGLQGDLQQKLVAQGYHVFTAAVGPFSSNWDRACELYAQIKGGQVDYGAIHAKSHGHHQHGRTYSGFYPQWGTKDERGKLRKLHFIGHSMGGQTIRMLAQLLAHGTEGSPTEEDSTTSGLLFQGGHVDWVHSITTLSSPNQGGTFSDAMIKMGSIVRSTILGVLGVAGVFRSNAVLDAKLDQWDFESRRLDESLVSYIARVFKSRALRPESKDYCFWSLSTEGAAEENKWVTTLPNVYYLSYTNEATQGIRFLDESMQVPNVRRMSPALYAFSLLISRFAVKKDLPESWQANDGLVNVESMASDGKGDLVEFQGTAYRGKWNHMATLAPFDHLDMIGFTTRKEVQPFYDVHVELLASLPEDHSEVQDATIGTVVPFRICKKLHEVVASISSDVQTKVAYSQDIC